MKKSLLFISFSLLQSSLSAAVEYDPNVPRLAFAAQELKSALKESGREEKDRLEK